MIGELGSKQVNRLLFALAAEVNAQRTPRAEKLP
jgi:hypothetical protein